MPGTRTEFVPDTANFIIRYGPRTRYQKAAVYLPNWTPSIIDLPEWHVFHFFQGGTLAGALGLDAMGIETGFKLEVARMVSNTLGAVVIAHDYTPGGRGLSTIEDLERVFWPEILDDGARVVQYFKTIAEDDMFGDRPLSRDPNKICALGSSSGGVRLALSQMLPDGAFDYSPGGASRDVWMPTHSHILNPMILSATWLAQTAYSKGGTGYTYYDIYKDAAWPYPLFQSAKDEEEPGWGWDNIPMALKRQADIAEHIRADNPRVFQVGLYLTAAHPASEIPRPTIVNDPTGVDARSFKRRYWRWLGANPAPIQNIRPVVDNVQAILGAVAAEGIFRHPGGGQTWVTQGYAVGQIIATSGFPTASVNDGWEILRFENADLDMVVANTDSKIAAVAAGAGQTVSGGGYYDLHDEWCCYDTYDRMLNTHGNLKCRLRAGSSGNTNPDPLTNESLATADDVKAWLTANDGTGFGWVVPT